MAFVSGFAVGVLMTVLALFALRLRRWAPENSALIVNTVSEVSVSFNSRWVWPIIMRVEELDLSSRTLVIRRCGTDGIICKDNIRVDLEATFRLAVPRNKEDALKIARSIGVQRAGDLETLESLFAAKFSEALKTVAKHFEFEQLFVKRDSFRDLVVDIIGEDLNGFRLEDVAIDYLEQTPLEHLDENNILDAQGLLKITEITQALKKKRASFSG